MLYDGAADPLGWEQHPVKDRYKEDVFRMFFREALESGGALIAMDAGDGRVIGSSRFNGYSASAAKWRSAGHSWRGLTAAELVTSSLMLCEWWAR